MYRWIAILIWAAVLVALPKAAYDDWKALRMPAERPGVTVNAATSTPTANDNALQVSSPAVANLFGVIPVAPKIAPKPIKGLPATRLNLKLTGTFTHQEQERASALITEGGNRSRRYFVGQQVPGNAELVAVSTDSVTLRRNGRDELLRFPRLSSDRQNDNHNSGQPVASADGGQPRSEPAVAAPQITRAELLPRQSAGQDAPPAGNSRSTLKRRLEQLRARNQKPQDKNSLNTRE